MARVLTFSGAHPFRLQCIRSALYELVDGVIYDEIDADSFATRMLDLVDEGRCPRCLGDLPNDPVLPAGSRVTRCRCIPVCVVCGDHEPFGGSLDEWPVVQEATSDEELAAWRKVQDATLDRARAMPATITPDGHIVNN